MFQHHPMKHNSTLSSVIFQKSSAMDLLIIEASELGLSFEGYNGQALNEIYYFRMVMHHICGLYFIINSSPNLSFLTANLSIAESLTAYKNQEIDQTRRLRTVLMLIE